MLQFYRRLSGENNLGVGLGAGPAGCSLTSLGNRKLQRTASIPETERDELPVVGCLQKEGVAPVSRARSNTCTVGDIQGMRAKYRSDSNLLHLSTSLADHHSSPAGSTVGREGFVSVGERERETELLTFSSPRLFQRRGGVVGDIDVASIQKLGEEGGVKVLVEEEKGGRQVSETIPADKKPLREAMDYIFIKHDLEVDWDPPTHYFVIISRNGVRTTPDLDLPTHSFAGSSLEVRPLQMEDTEEEESSGREEKAAFTTLQSCLSFFSTHGLVELPSSRSDGAEDEEEYHLPRVQPLDNIPRAWEDLPIKPEFKESLSQKQTSQQLAIWELIATEHSHIKQLEVIINLFMQALELVRRANVLTKDNYHSVFGGYMEELFTVHDQFWTWTLWPCLEQVYISGKPLDLSIIIQRFPEFSTQFEIYEQHCALDAISLRNLDKAMKNGDFRTYLEWCESHPVCQRRRLKDFLVIPMQRLTKYPLLFNAILRETTDSVHLEQLKQIWSEVNSFVQSVNTVLVAQTETERVRDAMSRIISYSAVDIPGEFRELMQPYTHLDLLTPMPEVEIDQPRVLVLEGNLKFRDHSAKMVAHIFLFTDLLLITRAKRGGDKFNIERPPYRISSLVLHPLEPGSFLVLVLTQYQLLTSWFTLKASTDAVATEWMQTICHAQKCYSEAVEKKVHHWKVLQSLRTERILNGLENRPSLGSMLSSRPSLSPPRQSLTTSTESLDHAHQSRLRLLPFELRPGQPVPMSRSHSAETRCKWFHSNPSLNQIRSSDPLIGRLERTSSLKTLIERPESGFASPAGSTHHLLSPHGRSHSMDQTQFPDPSSLAPPSPASSESELNIQETTNPIPELDSLSPMATRTRLPIATRVGFGTWSSLDENTVLLQRQTKVEEEEDVREGGMNLLGEDRNVVMQTPPTPNTPSPGTIAAPSAEKKSRDSNTGPAHKKSHKKEISSQKKLPREKSSTHPTVTREIGSTHHTRHAHLPGLASLKNAIQNRRQSHKTGKLSHTPSPSHPKQKKKTNKASHTHNNVDDSAHHKSGVRTLSKLGGATLAILSSIDPKIEGDKEREGERERAPPHTVIPTSGSDTESMSSSPRMQVVECISDITLPRDDQQLKEGTTTSECQDSNLKSNDPNEPKPLEQWQNKLQLQIEGRSDPPTILISQFSLSSSASESEASQSLERKRGFSPPPPLPEETTPPTSGEATTDEVQEVVMSLSDSEGESKEVKESEGDNEGEMMKGRKRGAEEEDTILSSVEEKRSSSFDKITEDVAVEPRPLLPHPPPSPTLTSDRARESETPSLSPNLSLESIESPSPFSLTPSSPTDTPKARLPRQHGHPGDGKNPRSAAARRGVRELSKLFESQNPPSLLVRKSQSTTAGFNLQLTGSHDDDSGRGLDESNLKKSVSTSGLHQVQGQREARPPLPPLSKHRARLREKSTSLDDLLTSPSSSLAVAMSIRNTVGQIQTKTDNYLLPGKLSDKQPRVNLGPVRGRKGPIPIPIQNGTRNRTMAARTKEVLNNGQLRRSQELNNHCTEPMETKPDHDSRPKPTKKPTLHAVQSYRLPQADHIVPQTGVSSKLVKNHSIPKETNNDRKLPNTDHSPPMVRALATKFGGTTSTPVNSRPNSTTTNHSGQLSKDHTPNGHAHNHTHKPRNRLSEARNGLRTEENGYQFMGVRIGNKEGGKGAGPRRLGGRSLERGRRVSKDQRPKVTRSPGNSNGNNNSKASPDVESGDVSRDKASPDVESGDVSRDVVLYCPAVGTTTVDKYGILRTMC